MFVFSHRRATIVAVLLLLAGPALAADPVDSGAAVSDVLGRFAAFQLDDTIIEAAKSLFWTLATISLVWTMGLMIVRQDIGELLMELVRFTIVTGLFYWILVNASSHQGGESFVEDIVHSFMQMASGGEGDLTVRTNADRVLERALHVYASTIRDTSGGELSDQLLIGGMAVVLLCMCAVFAGQVLLALVMAWVLGYAGIFLLGFGGARWTSPIAINFYKHVVAVGAALLALSIIGSIATQVLDEFGMEPSGRNYGRFATMGLMLAVSILLTLLSIKVPQLIYTLVTGSTLGFFAGSASAAGTAIATAGSSAYAAAMGRQPGGGRDNLPPSGRSGGTSAYRTDSVMDAVQRAAVATSGTADPFHTMSGSDAFGVPRAADPHRGGGRGRSVFGNSHDATGSTTTYGDASNEAAAPTTAASARLEDKITEQGSTQGEAITGHAQPNAPARAVTDEAPAEARPAATRASGRISMNGRLETLNSGETPPEMSSVARESTERHRFIADAAHDDGTKIGIRGRVDAPSSEAATRAPASDHISADATDINDVTHSTDIERPTAVRDARGARGMDMGAIGAAQIDRAVHADTPDVSAHTYDVEASTAMAHGETSTRAIDTIGGGGFTDDATNDNRMSTDTPRHVDTQRREIPGETHHAEVDHVETGKIAMASGTHSASVEPPATVSDVRNSAGPNVTPMEAAATDTPAHSIDRAALDKPAIAMQVSASDRPVDIGFDSESPRDANRGVTPTPSPLLPIEAIPVRQEDIKPAAPDEERLVVLAGETVPSPTDEVGRADTASLAANEADAPVRRKRRVRRSLDLPSPSPPLSHDDAAGASSIHEQSEANEDPT